MPADGGQGGVKMGLFSNSKKKKPEGAGQDAKENLKNFDPSIRPGGVFMAQLLMREQCAAPSVEQIKEVLSRHLGKVETFGDQETEKGFFSFTAWDYQSEFKDAKVPVQLSILGCEPFQAERIDDMKRSQMWDCLEDRDRILSDCKYAVLINDMLGGGLKAQIRANMLMDYLEAVLELYPSCEAVYFLNSGKLVRADTIRSGEIKGLDRYVRFCVNARFFNISGTNDHVVDTLGLSLLYIEDLQYHFHDMDPNWVVGHAYDMASYILSNDRPIKNGDTIDGIVDGRLVQEIQWKCQFEGSLIGPDRPVLDVCMGEYAAGGRQ